jgi:AcrR family transcriptional regulator
MKEKPKIDKRIIKTKNNLKTALVKLLETRKIEDITIVELTGLANVNRKTFYLHYADVSSILKEIENHTYDKTKELIQNFDLNLNTLENFIYIVCNIFVEDKHVYSLMKYTPYAKTFTNLLEKILIDEVNKKYTLATNTCASSSLQYTIAYHAFGSVRLFYTWMKNSQNVDLNMFSKFLATLVIKGVKGVFE